MARKLPAQIVNLLLATATVLVGVLGVEAAFRALDLFSAEREAAERAVERGAVRAADASDAPEAEDGELEPSAHWVIHPYRGISPRPAGSTEYSGVSYNVLGINSQSSDPRTLPKEAVVVGIFGGSVATGLGLNSAHILKAILEEAFGTEPEIQVINFGVSGYKQPQQTFLLQELLLLGTPIDVVINLDGFNELVLGRSNAQLGRHPLYPDHSFWISALGSTTGSLSRAQVRLLGQMESARARVAESTGFLARSPWAASAVVQALAGRRILDGEAAASLAEQRMRELPIRKLESDLWHLEDPCFGDPVPCKDLVIETWKKSSRMMAAAAAHGGALYLHVLQPNQYVEGSKTLTPQELERAWAPSHPWSGLAAEGYPALREAGRQLSDEGIPFFDATQIFKDSTVQDYVDTCCHLTHPGYRKLAEEIGRFMVESSIWPDSP